MAGEWIQEKARGLLGMFPGQWEELQDGTLQGECPGAHLHSHKSAKTDCRIYLAYGGKGQTPGIYCVHHSCKGVLEDLNKGFREALFAPDPNFRPQSSVNDGVVMRPPRDREAWIPEFDIGRLRQLTKSLPVCGAEFFMERSPVDPRKVTPGEYLEHVFRPEERVLVFTNFHSQGDFLWQVGKGGWRLSDQRGVKAVRSKLPVDGRKDGVWYLSNPVDGRWYPNPRREGSYSRRSMESVRAWRHLVVECDEEKTWRKRAACLRAAAPLHDAGKKEEAKAMLEQGGKKWSERMAGCRSNWEAEAKRLLAEAAEIPGLWMKFLALLPAAVVAVYSSGGESLHALLRVDQEDKPSFDSYLRTQAKRVLPIFGADPGAMTPVRLTRLPGCTRKGRMQQLIFLNPHVDMSKATPICDLQRLRSL